MLPSDPNSGEMKKVIDRLQDYQDGGSEDCGPCQMLPQDLTTAAVLTHPNPAAYGYHSLRRPIPSPSHGQSETWSGRGPLLMCHLEKPEAAEPGKEKLESG